MPECQADVLGLRQALSSREQLGKLYNYITTQQLKVIVTGKSNSVADPCCVR